MAVLALRTASPWSRLVLAFSWWALASAKSFLASSISWRVSGLTLLASAFLMVSSACLMTTGQLYGRAGEPTRTSAADNARTTVILIRRHSSLIWRVLKRRVTFFRGAELAGDESGLGHAAAHSAGRQSFEDRPVFERELLAVGRRGAHPRRGVLELLKGVLALRLARGGGLEGVDEPPPGYRRRVILKRVEERLGAAGERRDREDLVDF